MKPRRQFTDELKAQLVKLAGGRTPVSELAEEFDLNASLIHTRRRKALKRMQLGIGGAGVEGDQDEAGELRSLRRQVADLQLENEILKKAAVILGTKPQSKSGK